VRRRTSTTAASGLESIPPIIHDQSNALRIGDPHKMKITDFALKTAD